MKVKILEFDIKGDERGSLIALEACGNIPFDIKRAYYIFGTGEGVQRGFHAHRRLKQVAICVSGSCRFIIDDGEERREVLLDRPDRALYIDSFVWREMKDFSPGCVLLVLADQHYDKDDYILSYSEFKIAREGQIH